MLRHIPAFWWIVKGNITDLEFVCLCLQPFVFHFNCGNFCVVLFGHSFTQHCQRILATIGIDGITLTLDILQVITPIRCILYMYVMFFSWSS